jgi:hypothetical protein
MEIITQEVNDRIKQIARMEGTSSEIEFEIRMLCYDIAGEEAARSLLRTKQIKKTLEMLSFDSMRKRLYPEGNGTEYPDEMLVSSQIGQQESTIL